MDKKKGISAPKKGMQRNTSLNLLKADEYTFMLNGNNETETGEGLNNYNEPSNLLGINFPNGFKVLGYKTHLNSDTTFYFLTNPETKKSSIGYVINTENTIVEEDSEVQCKDCNYKRMLDTPLEGQQQNPLQQYVEIINDSCNGDLNLDINFPIKFIEIKDEKLGRVVYWTDFKNPPRKIEIDNIDKYLYTGNILCGVDNTTPTCIDTSKLLIQPNYSIPKITPEIIQTGGNLKMGTYEFLIAYSDQVGNEISEYYSITNPIPIFDENNKILEQSELDSQTNFAIRLKVEDLDTNFSFYKVVVIERTNLSQGESYYVEGIHSTSDSTVFYASSSTPSQSNITGSVVTARPRTTLENINSVKVRYEKVKGLVSSNNYLFLWGLIGKKEPNLQPIANLLGSFMQWGTSIAKESLYKSAIANSKYKIYPRDEVQSFAIRFLNTDGSKTATFPLIGRPANANDLTLIEEDDKNLLSLNYVKNNCSNTDRIYKWQIQNTAIAGELCSSDVEGDVIEDDVTKVCILEDVDIIEGTLTSGTLIVGATYIINNVLLTDDFTNVGFITEGEVFTATATTPTVWTNSTVVTKVLNLELNDAYIDLATYIEDNYYEIINPSSSLYEPELAFYLTNEYADEHCEPNFGANCGTPSLVDFEIEISNILNETTTLTEKEADEYLKTKAPSFCQPFELSESGGYEKDTDFITNFMECNEVVYLRASDFQNESCLYSQDVINNNDPNNSVSAFYNNYYGDEVLANLLISTKDSTCTDLHFNNKLHKGALWYKINKNNRDKLIFEITKNSTCKKTDDIPSVDKLRYSFYDTCSSSTPIYCEIIDSTVGVLTEVDTTVFSNEEFYVAIDVPIISVNVPTVRSGLGDLEICSDEVLKYRTAPPCGCYGVYTRDIEYTNAVVTFDSVSLDKKETYSATCEFILPNIADCEPTPYQKGEFAYWESTENYADNNELFNSSLLKITTEDTEDLTEEEKIKFSEYFVESLDDEEYILKETTDFRCKPIRHFKFPNNQIAPFMGEFDAVPFLESLIFPLGVSLDNRVVNVFLDIAVKNDLITFEERNKIEGFEILKGDNTVHKSIVAKTIGFDNYKYTEKEKDVFYSNYPLNDLGKDLLHLESGNTIPHPFLGEKNNMFSLMSADLMVRKPTLPTEISLDGYQIGKARGYFSDVDKHSKMVVLGKKAKTTATILGVAEAALEILIKTSEFIQQGTSSQFFIFGVSSGASLGLAGASAGLSIFLGASAVSGFFKVGEYRLQWLQIIRDLGTPTNHASFYTTEGWHNQFLKNEDSSNYLRGLSLKKYLKPERNIFTDENSGKQLKVNNFGREESTLVYLGENHFFEHPLQIVNYDNNTLDISSGSRTIASQNNCPGGTSEEIIRNTAIPYFTLKNYIPDQWGTIESIKWLTTGYTSKLNQNNSCEIIYGGTYVISRDWQHKKLPIFRETAMNLADKIPFSYSLYPNIAKPRFYIDYENGGDTSLGALLFPDIDSEVKFDCKNEGMYFKKPSKFYLYYHGFASYLVESEVNCNFRYSKKEIEDRYYPEFGDIIEYSQESKRSIFTKDEYFYNNVYSLPVTTTPYVTFPTNYKKEVWDKLSNAENGVIYSVQDNNENSLTDPWTIFKPLNRYEFPTKYGKLTQLKDLESATILGRFENQKVLFNAVDNLADQLSPITIELGSGGIFSKRPIDFKSTDLGNAGTQHSDMVSTPYGHFDVDAKRGKIFQLDQNGRDLQPISDFNSQQESGLKNWFREQLPFKILKQFPTLNIDNKFKGIGISMGWDARHDRVFITKKDYVVKGNLVNFTVEEGILKYLGEDANFNNNTLFEDVSWTIAYKPLEQSWVSYYSFTPDFYVNHNSYFQTGLNYYKNQDLEGTVWNHLITNRSYQVFYQEMFPFIVEFPQINENANKVFNSISLNIETKRYQNQWDFAVDKEEGFNKAIVYNNTNNSGIVNLVPQKNLSDIAKYPKTNVDNTQDILFTAFDDKHTFNYLFNRVKNQDNNIQQWLWDKCMINKTVNSKVVNFSNNKPTLERLRGEAFLIRLINDKESRFSIQFKNSINTEQIY